MLKSFSLAAAQLFHPSLRRYVLGGIVSAAVVFALLWAGVWWILSGFDLTELPFISWLDSFSGTLFDWIAGVLFVTTLVSVTLLLYPGTVIIIASLFLDQVADAVETRHFPNLPPARPQNISEVVIQSVRFTTVMVVLNIAALPIYAVLFFLPPLNIAFFYLLNGYLIGREYFELVALRRLAPKTARKLRKNSRGSLLISGAILTLLMTIPIVNLIAPVFGAAFMTHLFHRLAGEKGVTIDKLS
jgi:uncharacterized protein involved in cysteine biosynthesis